MNFVRETTVITIMDRREALTGARTGLVRLPSGADSALFGGWGVRI